MLASFGRDVIVPWPVFTEVDLLLRARGHGPAAVTFGRALAEGVHRLDAPTDRELAVIVSVADRYRDSGADLPDLTVMSMAAVRSASVLTWDFKHFRAVVLRQGHHWSLVVEEAELPDP